MMALVLIGTDSAWQVQGWRYGKQLADQARLHTETFNQLTHRAASRAGQAAGAGAAAGGQRANTLQEND